MNKYYFALLGALMTATCAMATPQSGDCIVAAQAVSVEWNDAAFRHTMDGASFDIGWKAQLNPSEDEDVLILNGLIDRFYIPIHVDYAIGKAWIETATPLDAYSDQTNNDVVRVIYALPEQWLADNKTDTYTNLYGSILDDGTIAFDGGLIFLVSESAIDEDFGAVGGTSETTWMSSPLFRNMRLLVPNAIHQFTKITRPDNLESILSTKTPSGSEQEYKRSRHASDLHLVSSMLITETGRMSGWMEDLDGGKKPHPRNPNGGTICSNGIQANNNDSSDGGIVASRPVVPFSNGDDNGIIKIVVHAGKKPFVPREARPCDDGGRFVGLETETVNPHVGLYALRPFNFDDIPFIRMDTLNAGKKPIIVNPHKPVGCGGGFGDNEVGFIRPNNGGDVYTPSNSNGTPNNVLDLTKSGYRPKPKNPNDPTGCSEPFPVQTLLVESSLPNRFSPSPSVASSKPGNDQFSEPVYVFQNPEDNSIMVYNLYGSGRVMSMSDCQVTPESITWGVTILYPQDGNIKYYFDSNALTFTDGTKFNVPAAIVKGDVSNDVKVDIADVTEMIDLMLTTGNINSVGLSKIAVDVNEDGKLNISDVTALIDYLLSGEWSN